MAERMTLYGGAYREEAIIGQVTRIGAGAGEIDCVECRGPAYGLCCQAMARSRARHAREPAKFSYRFEDESAS